MLYNIKHIRQGSMVRFNKSHNFYNNSIPSFNSNKDTIPWFSYFNQEKIYTNLPITSIYKSKIYQIQQNECCMFIDLCTRIIKRTHISNKTPTMYQIGVLLLHNKNIVFMNINDVDYDSFLSLPKDISNNLFMTSIFKPIS